MMHHWKMHPRILRNLTPPSKDISNVLPKWSRMALNTKWSYEGMQSRRDGAGRPSKKYNVQEILAGMSFDPLGKSL